MIGFANPMLKRGAKEALNKSCRRANLPSGAKARVDFVGFMYGLKPVPFKTLTYSEVP
jgi:hypothetical protein